MQFWIFFFFLKWILSLVSYNTYLLGFFPEWYSLHPHGGTLSYFEVSSVDPNLSLLIIFHLFSHFQPFTVLKCPLLGCWLNVVWMLSTGAMQRVQAQNKQPTIKLVPLEAGWPGRNLTCGKRGPRLWPGRSLTAQTSRSKEMGRIKCDKWIEREGRVDAEQLKRFRFILMLIN